LRSRGIAGVKAHMSRTTLPLLLIRKVGGKMKAYEVEIGMVVHGAIDNRYFQGIVESLFFAMDSDCGLVPSAQVKLLPDTDNFVIGEPSIIVPVSIFED